MVLVPLGVNVVEVVDEALRLPAGVRAFTTLEGENPTGSMKDRLVLGELTEALGAGVLGPGRAVSEVSAGSTARSLAYYCNRLGLGCVLFVPVTMPEADVAWLRSLGAEVRQVTHDDAYPVYERFCAEHDTHRFDQLFDPSKRRHYESLGGAVAESAGPIDAVVGAVGTGHSLLGSADGIEPRPQVVSAEPAREGAIPGIRNVALERYGPGDACSGDSFDERVVVDPAALFAGREIETDGGTVAVGDSFRLVLTAVTRHAPAGGARRLFLVGAENRRVT